MQIRVLLFGVLKDLTGRSEEIIELPAGARVQDLLSHYTQQSARLREMLPALALSVNQEYSRRDRALSDGDEVALLPPVSGGAGDPESPGTRGSSRVRIVREPIQTQTMLEGLKLPEDGAAVIFEGVVRNHTRGRRTLFLDYEAYETMALRVSGCARPPSYTGLAASRLARPAC
jgi:MoaE-MoaD fusion protein